MEKQTENKKIINAKKHNYDGIDFDSGLEVNCYKLLKEANLDFTYGKTRYELYEAFHAENLHIWMPNTKKQLIKNERKILAITMLPDFEVNSSNDKHIIIIETKGWANDQYAIRRKLLFDKLEKEGKQNDITYYYFEPSNIKQIKEVIEHIKLIKNNINESIR